jgi:hypothetical protein
MRLNMTQRIEKLAADNLALREQISLLTTQLANAEDLSARRVAEIKRQDEQLQAYRLGTQTVAPRTTGELSPFKQAAAQARALAAKTGHSVKVGA